MTLYRCQFLDRSTRLIDATSSAHAAYEALGFGNVLPDPEPSTEGAVYRNLSGGQVTICEVVEGARHVVDAELCGECNGTGGRAGDPCRRCHGTRYVGEPLHIWHVWGRPRLIGGVSLRCEVCGETADALIVVDQRS